MDAITLIKDLIFNGLFPIAMCAVLAWYIKYQKDTYTKQIDNLVATIDKLSDALIKLEEKVDSITNTTLLNEIENKIKQTLKEEN